MTKPGSNEPIILLGGMSGTTYLSYDEKVLWTLFKQWNGIVYSGKQKEKQKYLEIFAIFILSALHLNISWIIIFLLKSCSSHYSIFHELSFLLKSCSSHHSIFHELSFKSSSSHHSIFYFNPKNKIKHKQNINKIKIHLKKKRK